MYETRQSDNLKLQSDAVCAKRNRIQSSSAKPGKAWQKTRHANSLHYVPSGTYLAQIRVGSKLIRRSLESTALSVAKLKLADLEKEERTRQRFGSGKATFSDLLVEYRTRLEATTASSQERAPITTNASKPC
jgi:hypothetical protein